MEQATLEVLAQRLAPQEACCVSELMELEEGLALLDKDDQKQCTDAHEAVRKKVAVSKAFMDDWTSDRRKFHKTLVLKKKKRGATTATAQGWSLPDGTLEHAQLKPLVPAGGHLWRNNASGGWGAHFKPFGRVAFSAAKWGPRGSAIGCLRYLWECYCTYHALAQSACPVQGLFDDSLAESVLPQASSSSSSK